MNEVAYLKSTVLLGITLSARCYNRVKNNTLNIAQNKVRWVKDEEVCPLLHWSR